tara:strand:- start:2032 stop:2259 length:228 start_codon:yes stop_codon:yes gene_type:complete
MSLFVKADGGDSAPHKASESYLLFILIQVINISSSSIVVSIEEEEEEEEEEEGGVESVKRRPSHARAWTRFLKSF